LRRVRRVVMAIVPVRGGDEFLIDQGLFVPSHGFSTRGQ
jgi:hypothetical protein